MAYAILNSLVFATLMTLCSARAVNISNTWMLPEEGFPVFYRYFRDRISWYEADAVCQFHHANLVTADSSSQYDAIRAYLKELDITENVWIGLSKTSDKPNFTWTDFKALGGEGHWQEATPKTTDPMCVTMDPAVDFLWKALPCGGPAVASFICELPIPSWALGPRGCLLTELPSLTVLYIPEQSAVELTSDCGLDGTKRIACKGDADREEILKQLTCVISQDDFDEKSTKAPVTASSIYDTSDETSSSKTTKTWIWTSNTVDIDYGMPTRHRRETEDTLSPVTTKSTSPLSASTPTMSSFERVTKPLSMLEVGVSKAADKSGIRAGRRGFTTQGLYPEDAGEIGTTLDPSADPKISVADIQESSLEYPSAINQGQLFSIIENGTMFDIIELNETNSEAASKIQQTPITPEIRNDSKYVTTEHPTVAHSSKDKFPNNKVAAKPEKTTKKDIHKKPVIKVPPKDSIKSEGKHTKEAITKEVEMYHDIKDTSILLNRTFRKELPAISRNKEEINDSHKLGKSKLINLSVNNDLSDLEHDHFEIQLEEGGNNNTETLLLTASNGKFAEFEREDQQNSSKIDYSIEGTANTTTKSSNNEDIKEKHTPSNTDPLLEMKKQFLPKSLLNESGTMGTLKYANHSGYETSENPLDAEPEGPPKPNRQRQLTRPQRRSFYPNFFSRVLG